MVGKTGRPGRLPGTLQGLRAMCRVDWRESLRMSLVVTRMADQRVKLRVTPQERMVVMLKLHKPRNGTQHAAFLTDQRALACA